MDRTCEDCPYHRRWGENTRDNRDMCFIVPGAPVLRQSSGGYAPDYPPACSEKPKAVEGAE